MHLFAYGTLMDPEIMAEVSGMVCRCRPAILADYIRKTVRDEVYPAIIHRPYETVDGIVYFDLSRQAFDRLDRFEGPMYQRTIVTVTNDDGRPVDAQTYVIGPHFADQLSDESWDFDAFVNAHKNIFQRNYLGYAELE